MGGESNDVVTADGFSELLAHFADAVVANDGARLVALFTADGVYEDEFFGAHRGGGAIAAMLQRFHDTGSDYRWDFFQPVCDGTTGYARYCFSYRSLLPESEGRAVAFEGIGQFRLEDGKIAHYREVFDRGVALVQLGFAAERIRRIVEKAAAVKCGSDEARAHLQRFDQANQTWRQGTPDAATE